MQKLLVLFSLLTLLAGTACQQSTTAQQQESPSIKFNTEGKLKIIQFTDMHYILGKPAADTALLLVNEMLDTEHPDMVVFTGDIVFDTPVLEGLDKVFETVEQRQIPWAYVLGNHDDEYGTSRQEIMEHVMQKPNCLAQHGDAGIQGVGNYIVEVKGRDSKKTEALLYFLDSRSYNHNKSIDAYYDWIHFSQVDWYRQQSAAYTQGNNGTAYPALAFFHIPLPEYNLMTADSSIKIVGERRENECSPKLNSGMFLAMLEAGDVMGVFTGHDHDNDYIGQYHNIALAYGRFSGGNTVYNNLGLNGCRVIELREGQRGFDSYIRLRGGQKLYEVKMGV